MITREQVIEIANQARHDPILGFGGGYGQRIEVFEFSRVQLERFAAACYRMGVMDSAAVCQIKTACYGDGLDDMWEHGIDHGRTQCAEEIRSLLEQTNATQD